MKSLSIICRFRNQENILRELHHYFYQKKTKTVTGRKRKFSHKFIDTFQLMIRVQGGEKGETFTIFCVFQNGVYFFKIQGNRPYFEKIHGT